MARDSFVGDAMSPTSYSEAMAECERLRDRLAEEAMRNRELREERGRLRRDLAAAREALRQYWPYVEAAAAGRMLTATDQVDAMVMVRDKKRADRALATAPAPTLGDGGHTA